MLVCLWVGGCFWFNNVTDAECSSYLAPSLFLTVRWLDFTSDWAMWAIVMDTCDDWHTWAEAGRSSAYPSAGFNADGEPCLSNSDGSAYCTVVEPCPFGEADNFTALYIVNLTFCVISTIWVLYEPFCLLASRLNHESASSNAVGVKMGHRTGVRWTVLATLALHDVPQLVVLSSYIDFYGWEAAKPVAQYAFLMTVFSITACAVLLIMSECWDCRAAKRSRRQRVGRVSAQSAAQARLASAETSLDNVQLTELTLPVNGVYWPSPPTGMGVVIMPAGHRLGVEGAAGPVRECAICMDRQMDTAFNCGHQCCGDCAASIQTCHVCRAHVTNRIKLYD